MITVVIPVYNEIKYLDETLASISEQADYIFLSDNASTDGTSEFCANLAATAPNVTHVRYEKNLGAASMLQSINSINTEYMFLMGGHDKLEHGYIKNCYDALIEAKAIHAFGCVKHCYPNKKEEDIKALPPVFASKFDSMLLLPYLARDSVFERVSVMSRAICCTQFYGLYKTEFFHKALKMATLEGYPITDHAVLTAISALGKSAFQTKSCFLYTNPRPPQTYEEQLKRINNSYYPNEEKPLYLWPQSIFKEQMKILESLKAQTPQERILLFKIKYKLMRWWGKYLDSPYSEQ